MRPIVLAIGVLAACPAHRHVQVPAVRATCVDPRGATYPWRHRTLSPAEVDQRKAAFTARNPGAWTIVTLTDAGLVFHLESADPSIVRPDPDHPDDFTDADRARWTAFVRANADFFGITDPSALHLIVDPLTARPIPNILEAQQSFGVLAAEIAIGKHAGTAIFIDGTLWPIAACPRHDDESLAARVIGSRYLERTTWFRMPPLDCGMAPNPKGCGTGELVGQATAERTADRAHVSVLHAFVDVPRGAGQLEKRHIACIAMTAPDAKPDGVFVDPNLSATSIAVPIGQAPPLPLAVDVVTGEQLDASLCPNTQGLRSP